MCPDAAGAAPGQKGFTLIELMVVVAIVGLLAVLVIPSYQDSVRKARRTDAKTAVTTIAQLMERYNTQNNSYLLATLGVCGGAAGTIPFQACSENGFYAIEFSKLTVNEFVITATAQGSQAADTACPTYTINEAGVRGPTGTVATCW